MFGSSYTISLRVWSVKWPSRPWSGSWGVTDRLSKYAHFVALSHSFSAKIVVEHFVKHVIKLHGMPKSIISDPDPIFISKLWQEFFTMSGTKLKLSSAYHPQTDGQTEVVNRCVEQYLLCLVHQWPWKWYSYLPWVEFWYNTTYHSSTGMTPFQALYGRLPPSIPLYFDGLSRVHEVDQSLLHRDELLQHLKKNLDMTTNRMKQMADQKKKAWCGVSSRWYGTHKATSLSPTNCLQNSS